MYFSVQTLPELTTPILPQNTNNSLPCGMFLLSSKSKGGCRTKPEDLVTAHLGEHLLSSARPSPPSDVCRLLFANQHDLRSRRNPSSVSQQRLSKAFIKFLETASIATKIKPGLLNPPGSFSELLRESLWSAKHDKCYGRALRAVSEGLTALSPKISQIFHSHMHTEQKFK